MKLKGRLKRPKSVQFEDEAYVSASASFDFDDQEVCSKCKCKVSVEARRWNC